jgi:hypothetical protein
MKIIILSFTLLFSQFTFSQSQSGWSTVTFSNDRVFLFNRDDLKIEGNISKTSEMGIREGGCE